MPNEMRDYLEMRQRVLEAKVAELERENERLRDAKRRWSGQSRPRRASEAVTRSFLPIAVRGCERSSPGRVARSGEADELNSGDASQQSNLSHQRCVV
jgi:hypothetical protein